MGGPESSINAMNTVTEPVINGIDTDALRGAIDAVRQNPAEGRTTWHVASTWRGGTRTDHRVTRARIGSQELARDFTIHVDEPAELCGTNEYPNPQETLLAGLNACMSVGYAVCASMHGIKLHELRIETEGDIDLQGMFELDEFVPPGYRSLQYTVYIKADATEEQLEALHQQVMMTSPNYYNLARPVRMNSKLVVLR